MIAVLDWELSTTGQPLADFAYFLMHHYWPLDMNIGSMGSLKGIEGDGQDYSNKSKMSTNRSPPFHFLPFLSPDLPNVQVSHLSVT